MALKTDHASKPYPHVNCCSGCRAPRVCNHCATPKPRDRRQTGDWCVNGRCGACCRKHCTHIATAADYNRVKP